jgi:hypothetical protein
MHHFSQMPQDRPLFNQLFGAVLRMRGSREGCANTLPPGDHCVRRRLGLRNMLKPLYQQLERDERLSKERTGRLVDQFRLIIELVACVADQHFWPR